tara:strand:+ start:922 stop:1332 length:411 start_codon:yes stop_codon:yes gene_type:complete
MTVKKKTPAKKKTPVVEIVPPKKKPLYKSLTIQSACLLAVLIIVRAYAPEHLSEELFQTLLAVFGLGSTIGLRRAMPIVLLCLLPLGAVHCGPSYCEKVSVEIVNHPELTSPPAGKVLIKCDGKLKAELLGKKVNK